MYTYLKTYTNSSAQKDVLTGGRERIFEIYRKLCDRCRSRRAENLIDIRNFAGQPRKAVPLGQLQDAISSWEREKRYCFKICPDWRIEPEDERIMLIKMCPADLEKHLKRDDHRWPSYDEVLAEIHEHLARERPQRPAAHATSSAPQGTTGADGLEEHWLEDADEMELTEEDLANFPPKTNAHI
jgi:hypothetical protein